MLTWQPSGETSVQLVVRLNDEVKIGFLKHKLHAFL